jgi:hypothetical protein
MSELAKMFKDSATQLGLFYPKHYLIAAFRDLDAAQKVCHKLRDAGFAEEDAFAVPGRELIQLEKDEAGLGNFLMQGLSRFFATEQVTSDQDLEKARLGAAFVAVYCPQERLKEEAKKIIEAGGPLAARYYGGDGIEHLAGDAVTN